MLPLEKRNQKMIEAIIKKANHLCPDALALIGINGSFMRGDFYEKSDLDLLVLVNDDRDCPLACAFIQDDLQVGHDIYCTTWERLESDARYEHPHISKLMDAKIVYCADEKHRNRLDALRQMARAILAAPFSEEDYLKAETLLKEAEHAYTAAMVSQQRTEVLDGAGRTIYYIENALAMLNKQYFHYGVNRTYDELKQLQYRPERICDRIEAIISAPSAASVQKHLSVLMGETLAVFQRVKESLMPPRKPVTKEALTGTYEEMYSNWRNKMYAAAKTENRHLAFMSLISSNAMFSEIREEADISRYDALKAYNAQDLHETAKAYDDMLNEYLSEYKKADIQVRRYADIDAFALAYEKAMDL
ncbi:MAG: hypothetical protein HFE64_03790 [Lachnospiraceae bacterium]|jgi:predicted nucleotidyltransferase|nr:hypothetical protein [Lachnospiraceae bacterium]